MTATFSSPFTSDWVQELWDGLYGREDALRGGLSPEEYDRFAALETLVRAAAARGYRLRTDEERARRRAEWQDEQDERAHPRGT
jgi:hypothetical protein